MHDLLTEVSYSIFDIVLYLSGIAFLGFLLMSFYQYRETVQDDVNTKYGVYEMKEEYRDDVIAVPAATIIADLRTYDISIPVKVRSHEITVEDKNKLIQFNDASGITRYLDMGMEYEKKIETDNEGNITGISYNRR